MHPYIEEFINSDIPIATLLQKYSGSSLTVNQILRLQKGLIDSSLTEKTYLDAEKYAESNSEEDSVLLYSFYAIWANTAIVLNRHDDLRVIYNRSKDVCKNPPPVLEIACKQLYYAINNKDEVREYTKNTIDKYYNTSPRFQNYLIKAIVTFSRLGEGKSFEEIAKRLIPEKINKIEQWLLDYSCYVNDVCTGKCELSEDQIAQIENEKKEINFNIDYGLDEIKLLRKLFKGGLELNAIDLLPISQQLKEHLKVNCFLLNNKLEDALLYKVQDRLTLRDTFRTSFFNTTEIRLKLSNREYKSAINLLRQKVEERDMNYFDDFYRVRIHLLEGDINKAIFYFKKLYKNCLYYESLGLLDVELNASLEMGAKQIRMLMSMVNDSINNIDDVETSSKLELKEFKGADKIIGTSQAIISLKDQIKRISDINMPILITGETGVGKDLVANAIHEESTNSNQPFLPINCGAILDSLLLSELYGHEKGAFTGAIKSKKGIFEMALNGTVFLDEIGEISPSIQVALLRSLESNRVRPVGSAKDRPYSCRIISATNRSLEEMVKENSFREDLFYRIKLIEIKVPALRDRSEDIIPLMDYFLTKYEKSVAINFDDELTKRFETFDWPGNIRQLKSEIDKMCVLNQDKLTFTINECELFHHKSDIKTTELNDDSEKNVDSQKSSFDKKLEKILANSNSSKNRNLILKEAFDKSHQLSRREVVLLLEVSASTADKDLNQLIKEKYIKKIMPTAARRTHFYQKI